MAEVSFYEILFQKNILKNFLTTLQNTGFSDIIVYNIN